MPSRQGFNTVYAYNLAFSAYIRIENTTALCRNCDPSVQNFFLHSTFPGHGFQDFSLSFQRFHCFLSILIYCRFDKYSIITVTRSVSSFLKHNFFITGLNFLLAYEHIVPIVWVHHSRSRFSCARSRGCSPLGVVSVQIYFCAEFLLCYSRFCCYNTTRFIANVSHGSDMENSFDCSSSFISGTFS